MYWNEDNLIYPFYLACVRKIFGTGAFDSEFDFVLYSLRLILPGLTSSIGMGSLQAKTYEMFFLLKSGSGKKPRKKSLPMVTQEAFKRFQAKYPKIDASAINDLRHSLFFTSEDVPLGPFYP